MRICFIADSSSIHVKRIVSHCVRKKDDVLVLSSAPYISNIPGARIVHLLISNQPPFAISSQDQIRKIGFSSFLRSFSPMTLNRVIRTTIRGLHFLRKRGFCMEQIEGFNPEVIFCNRSFPEGVLASQCHVRPLLLRTAGPDISYLTKYPVYRQVIRKALQTADVVMTQSLWERELLRDLCGVQVDPEVNNIGVDTDLFRPSNSRDRLRDKYGLPRDAFVVVSNRSLEGRTNGWLVVKAIQSILDRYPNLVLLYVNPSQMRPRAKAKSEAIAGRFPPIKFLEGPLPHAEIADILRCGDVYISFSSFDGIPNSVLEAMACGLVPVVAELPQLHEWIEQGVSGYLIPQRDTKSLAAVVSELYKNRQALSDISVRCVSRIREQGSYEVCMERTRDLLKYLIQAER